ncbi:pleckstrin homology domain-containing family H member 1-like [Anneissia japonica]|uniref:pleckstrin homology domain-containing family H member 1-like n=1 Tax=Anneissia japonica TaxID=1529436 RepID=UPI0014259661|nr:pleckstrin homology domain-containing family H member 1-like [Anneissia japonica]
MMLQLEQRIVDAESRRDNAEMQVKEMANQLSSVKLGREENQESSRTSKEMRKLVRSCQIKEEEIMALQSELDQQKSMREEDGLAVEEKAAKIKEWVTQKLSNLEQENQHLRLSNQRAQELIRSLQKRLIVIDKRKSFISSELIPTPTAPTRSHTPMEYTKMEFLEADTAEVNSPRACSPPKVPARPSIRGKAVLTRQDADSSGDEVRPMRPTPPKRTRRSPGESPVHALIKVHEELIKIEEEKVNGNGNFMCMACEWGKERLPPGLHEEDEDWTRTWPRRFSRALTDTMRSQGSCDTCSHHTSREPLAREQMTVDACIQTDGYDDASLHPEAIAMEHFSNDAVSATESEIAAGEIPGHVTSGIDRESYDPDSQDDFTAASQIIDDELDPDNVEMIGHISTDSIPESCEINGSNDYLCQNPNVEADNAVDSEYESNQYAPITYQDLFASDDEETNGEGKYESMASFHSEQLPSENEYYLPDEIPPRLNERLDSKSSGVSNAASPDLKNKPPPPPLHKMPSWENRIYNVASEGIRMSASLENLTAPSRKSSAAIYQPGDNEFANAIYKEMDVPVYTTLRGAAAQIRSTPFTGESSDSSDEEYGRGKRKSGKVGISKASVERTTVASTVSATSSCRSPDPSAPSAKKRGVSGQSAISEGDYAIPPDAMSFTDSNHSEEPEHKLLKTCAAYTTENMKKEAMEKCGWLTKLGVKVKSWKRRWFVLKNGELRYYKSQNDVSRKAQGLIPLDGMCKIARSNGAHTFELVTTKRVYYLTADSTATLEEWIQVLQNVLRRYNTQPMFEQTGQQPAIKGWINKVKHGHSKKCWCVLLGKTFAYFKNQEDKLPVGTINMRETQVEEVDCSMDSDDESRIPVEKEDEPKYVIVIHVNHQIQGPTYLLMNSKEEKDTWLYHLTVASGSGLGNIGTEYERLIAKLMDVEGDPSSTLWRHPHLCQSKDSIDKPLTTLPSEALKKEAVKLNKACNLFINVMMDSPAIDYHVNLAQSALQTCVTHPELQNEMYCQLIKQTTPKPPITATSLQNLLCGTHNWFASCEGAGHTSISSSMVDLTQETQNSTPTFAFLQAWQLLAMCTTLFLPRQKFMWLLKIHLQNHFNSQTEVGKYAIFCQRTLERTLKNGVREARPSRTEVLSIILRNPFYHSHPISVPVHFMNGLYQVVSFDGSTTVRELITTLNQQIGMRDTEQSGFALFTDDPSGRDAEHCLQGSVKVCDVISKWEQTLKEAQNGKIESTKVVKLTYKNRLYFRREVKKETERERLLVTYQINDDVIHGRFPLNKELALELAALMIQIDNGDCKHSADGAGTMAETLDKAVDKFYPKRYKTNAEDEMRTLKMKLSDKWTGLRGRTQQECIRIYLGVTRKWPFLGAKLFSAKTKFGNCGDIYIAVQDDSISLLDYSTLILEITLLIASYINAIVKQQNLTYEPSSAQQVSPSSVIDKKVWDFESSHLPEIGKRHSRLL